MQKLTILHSNDMHGDFTPETMDGKMVGGMSMLSGYVSDVRATEENVLYTISGDMFRGSLIDSEYKGLSTIEIVNMLAPDIATIGNHEIDYGISHLLFLEKCAKFPIINSNLFIKTNHSRLFQSHQILTVGNLRVLLIGVMTQEVFAKATPDVDVGSLIDVWDASEEVGKICDSYRTEDIDLTVLLTHIGLEDDKKLAAALDPRWGVDLILGGHSHTVMDEPVIVNGVLIAQAGCGTNQVGRFDLSIDEETNSIVDYSWQLVPIDEEHCHRDLALEEVLRQYTDATDLKYNRFIVRFADTYTHPRRDRESDIGKIFTDLLKDSLGVDLMMIGSGTFRASQMGPIVQYRDIIEMFPFDDEIIRIALTGSQIKTMISHIFRPEALVPGVHTEFYQFSRGISFEVHLSNATVHDLTFKGKPFSDTKLYTVGLPMFHYLNSEPFFGLSESEIKQNKMPKIIATKMLNVVEECLLHKELITVPKSARWKTVE